MFKSRGAVQIALILFVCFGSLALAQTAPGVARPTSSNDRLFLSFAEDATVVDRQWWEGQVEAADDDDADASIIRAVVAFQPWVDMEVGGRGLNAKATEVGNACNDRAFGEIRSFLFGDPCQHSIPVGTR